MSIVDEKFHHEPVMLNYLLSHVVPHHTMHVLDATLGEGGHSEGFLQNHYSVTAIERDKQITEKAFKRLQQFVISKKLKIVEGNYGDAQLEAFKTSQPKFDFALFDLGISKFHYFASGRGFSFANSEPLDMRLDSSVTESAAEVVNFYSEQRLADVLYMYGEMTNARVMAKHICKQRQKSPINTSSQLAEIIKAGPHYAFGANHPATQAFQALRVYVNKELAHISGGLQNAIKHMNSGGRVAVISYHSLEDRIVKKTFHEMLIKRENINKYAHLKNSAIKNDNRVKPLNYEQKLPAKNVAKLRCKLFNKKAIVASRDEVLANRAARSAKLRVLEINNSAS